MSSAAKAKRSARTKGPPRPPRDWLDWATEAPLLAALALSPWLCGAFQPGLAPPPGREFRALWPYVVSALVLLSLAASARRDLDRRYVRSARVAPPYVFALLFAALTAATMLTTVSFFASANEALRVAVAVALMWLVGRITSDDEAALKRVVGAVIFGAALPAMVGVQQYISNVIILNNKTWRTFGTFATPNSLAGHEILIIPLTLGALLVSRERKLRLLLVLVLAVQLACLVVTFSKAGFLSLVLAAGLYLVLVTGGPLRRRLVPAVCSMVVLVALALLVPPLRNRFLASFTTENHSWMFRCFTLAGTLRAFVDNWLCGTGAGTFPSAYPKYALTDFTRHAHNSFLQLAMECGVFALASFLALLGAAAYCGWRTAGLAPASWRGRATQGALAGVAASCVHNLFDYDWYIFPTYLAFFAALGLCSGAPARGDPAPAATRRRAWVKFALCALLGVSLLRGGLARYYYEAGQALARAGDITLARENFARATRLDPKSPLYLEALLGLQRATPAVLARQYERVFALDRAAPDPHLRLALRLAELGALSQAAEQCREALERFPNYTEALIELAALAQEQGDEQTAKNMLQRVAQLEHAPYGRYKPVPERPDLEFLYAHAGLAELGEPGHADQALALARKFLSAYRALYNQFSDMFPKDPQLVRQVLRARGFTPERVRQVEIILAWLLCERGAPGDREEAARLSPRSVERLEEGTWRGVLLETAQDRRRGGIG